MVVWGATRWNIWCERNICVFRQQEFNEQRLIQNIMFYSWLWIKKNYLWWCSILRSVAAEYNLLHHGCYEWLEAVRVGALTGLGLVAIGCYWRYLVSCGRARDHFKWCSWNWLSWVRNGTKSYGFDWSRLHSPCHKYSGQSRCCLIVSCMDA